jgi:hypothetical protein
MECIIKRQYGTTRVAEYGIGPELQQGANQHRSAIQRLDWGRIVGTSFKRLEIRSREVAYRSHGINIIRQ